MKKNKSKVLARQAKKTAFNDIKTIVVQDLNEFTAKLGKGSKKLGKVIKKASKKLAKKISKELNIKKTYSEVSDIPSAAIIDHKIVKTEIAQPGTNPVPEDSKPIRKRASIKTTTPVLASATSIKKAPVTRTKRVIKSAEPSLK